MKTYREFVEQIYIQLFEDMKTSLSQRELDLLNKLRKEGGRRYANEVRATLAKKSIRNLPDPEERTKRAVSTINPTQKLGKGEFKRFDRDTQTWISNKN